jgi:hypothetical protein
MEVHDLATFSRIHPFLSVRVYSIFNSILRDERGNGYFKF